jgi:8-oxo-dGTP pyrophosphatase MutT (NUDIX family)
MNTLPIRLNRTVIYESPWVNLYRGRVVLPTGRILEQYHLLDFGRGAVAVIVEDEQGRILMEQVARYPTGTVGWELPAGRIEADEPILEAARREVLEETGYETSDHRQVYAYHPMNGISNLAVHVVCCRAGAGSSQWDEDEVGQIGWFTPAVLKQMIGRGEITDGFALVGLLLHFNRD